MNVQQFTNQAHAEDVFLRSCFLYYVENKPALSDMEFDALGRDIKKRWKGSLVESWVASDDARDYPLYIRQGRRPDKGERIERDRLIGDRWLEHYKI